jgi:hypothetical protein
MRQQKPQVTTLRPHISWSRSKKPATRKSTPKKNSLKRKRRPRLVKKYVGWAIKGIVFVAGLAPAPEVVIPAAAIGRNGGSIGSSSW